MGPLDLALAVAIVAGAGWLLYRSALKRSGGCCGCSQAGSCGAPRRDVVRLGRGAGRTGRPVA